MVFSRVESLIASTMTATRAPLTTRVASYLFDALVRLFRTEKLIRHPAPFDKGV
jgi:hypothetical protein